VPGDFGADVMAEADRASSAVTSDLFASVEGARPVDRTDVEFVTLDPVGSTDLDQAFSIEQTGDEVTLLYAIADVGRFVRPGGAIDQEAWRRGVTVYLPDGRASLHPPQLAEAAASLLPDGPRPAVVFTVRVAGDGAVRLVGAERSVIRSRAKLAYATVTLADLPHGFVEFVRRVEYAEAQRGASRVDEPEQQVVATESGFSLQFNPRNEIERQSATLSLATNMAVADVLYAARTGLFRTMDAVDERRTGRLRNTARAFGLDWPNDVSLADFLRLLAPDDPAAGAFQLAVRRAGGAAKYRPFEDGVVPWHAAIAATYCHATAPLRRLADRYVIEAAVAVVAGRAVPDWVVNAFDALPDAMQHGDALASTVDRAALDAAEAVVLAGREGEVFDAVVTDEDDRGVRIQICEPAVVARVAARHVDPGDAIRVRLTATDPTRRTVEFDRVS
jgi:exoribonuclease R